MDMRGNEEETTWQTSEIVEEKKNSHSTKDIKNMPLWVKMLSAQDCTLF